MFKPVACLLATVAAIAAQPLSTVFPGAVWEERTPVESKWSEVILAEARRLAATLGSSAVFVVDRGTAVAQWGDVTRPINFRSGRKSLLNALIGIAVDRQQLQLEHTLAKLGIDDVNPPLDAAEKRATVGQLLTSRSGVYHPAAYVVPGTKLPARHTHRPGEFFFYNNWDFNALGTIYERAASRPIFEAFETEIARPLRFQDFDVRRDTQSVKEELSLHPAYIFRMSARDLARFGWLYANAGNWNGRQLISAEWVRQSTQPHVPNARAQNAYGYLWWVNVNPETREQLFWAAGAGGQFVLVMPERRIVIVHLVDIPVLSEAMEAKRTVSWGDFFKLVRLIASASPDRQ